MTPGEVLESRHVWIVPDDTYVPVQVHVLGRVKCPSASPLVLLGVGGEAVAEDPGLCYPTREKAAAVARHAAEDLLALAEADVRKFRHAILRLGAAPAEAVP